MAQPTTECVHIDQVKMIAPLSEGCEQCVEMGDTWVNLRKCAECGQVGCCDSSKNKHATGHYRSSGHFIVQSNQPGETWYWCYECQALFELD